MLIMRKQFPVKFKWGRIFFEQYDTYYKLEFDLETNCVSFSSKVRF